MVDAYVSWSANAEAGPSRMPAKTKFPPSSRRTTRRRRRLAWTLLAAASTLSAARAQIANPVPRWGQASALFGDHLLIHGGKTNGNAGGGGYTYTSGVNTDELLLLDLTQGFTSAAAPWKSINTTNSPAVAFHTLSPIRQGSQLLAFGGDGTTTLTGNDSAYMLQLSDYSSATWSAANAAWYQPQRRIHHSAETDGSGEIWIIGGERADGSQTQMNELWRLNEDAASPRFRTGNAPSQVGLVGSTATFLHDGTLLVLGGQRSTGLQSFANLTTYSTTTNTWSTLSIKGANTTTQGYPAPRQGHVAVTLPNQRIFLHGGASLDWTQAMGDAWILDWSASPPTWSEVSTSSGSSAPSARFAHSAVAWGERVVMAFGWAGNNEADAAPFIFDASSLTQSSAGIWSGGSWSSTYSPDPNAAPSTGTGNSGSGSGTSGGNGSSSNNGGGSSSSGNNGGSSNSPASTPPTATSGPGPSGSNNDSTSGAKAGAALGALLGVGLIAGAGYMVYRKRHQDLDDYRHGDGADNLLRGSNHYYGADDDPFMLEKGMEYTGVGPGGVASFNPGTKPMGPRTAPPRSQSALSPLSLANIGHAMEGSGPHLRERLALLTGIGLGGAASKSQQQQRFNMLADEDDDHRTDAFALEPRKRTTRYDDEVDDEEDDRYHSVAKNVRERSYGRVEQFDEDDDHYRVADNSLGDLGQDAYRRHDRHGDFVMSPFEEEVDAALGGGALVRDRQQEDDDRDEDSGSFVHTIDTGDMTSNTSQSHANTSSSKSAQHSHSSGGGAAGVLSFSDSVPVRRGKGSGQNGPSPMVQRSPTWWDRFMGQSFLERSASGRLFPGPRAEEPIRDPAEPPMLNTIRESPRSAQPSEDNPFQDPYAADEMGRYTDPYADRHARSQSSLQSGRTMTSSVMEAQLQNMVVVQRAGTTSSRRTYSSGGRSQMTSDDGLGRSVSIRSSTGHPQSAPSDTDTTPGSVVFDPSEWNKAQIPRTVEEGDETGGVGEMSLDMAELDYTPILHIGRKRANTSELMPALAETDDEDMSAKRSKTAMRPVGRTAKAREASDAPSLTPSTTKRARQNTLLTSPLSPQPTRVTAAPVHGSVLDRVKAIERKRADTGEDLLPVPRSPGVNDVDMYQPTSPEVEKNHMFVPGRGGRPILTRIATSPNGQHESDVFVTSPLRIKSPETANKDKVRYSHGLAPKPQLFVANPDGRQASSDS